METVKLSKAGLLSILLAIGGLAGVLLVFLLPTPYTSVMVFTILLLVWGSFFAVSNKEKMSEMCCMMSGMAYGMISGFFIGAVAGLATGDFMIAMIIGSLAGILFGIPVGRIGGPLGRMEGVMAGPMGGIMGGMTGVMIQFFDVQLFMPFLAIVVAFTVWEMTSVIKKSSKMSGNFMMTGIALSILAVLAASVNVYQPQAQNTIAFGQNRGAETTAVLNGPVQEVTIDMEPLGYNPDYIVLQKDVPARITLNAGPKAGCTRAIVFPEFGIRKTVAKGSKEVVEFTPTKAGTFPFSCSMSMAGGTIVVK